MAKGRKKNEDERPVFDSIRKPTAPPSRKFGDGSARETKILPSMRKAKHKKAPPQDE